MNENDNKSIRIICAVLFVLMAILSMMVSLHTVTWVIPDRLLTTLLFATAFSVWKSDYWGPMIGIWVSLIGMGYAVIEMSLIYFIDLEHYSSLVPAAYLIVPLIVMAVITCFICVRLLGVEKIKFKKDGERRKIQSPGTYGNCPKCGFDQIKFIDGVNYKCARCGKIY